MHADKSERAGSESEVSPSAVRLVDIHDQRIAWRIHNQLMNNFDVRHVEHMKNLKPRVGMYQPLSDQYVVGANCAVHCVRVSMPSAVAKALGGECVKTVSDDLKKELIVLLPRLRRFARTLTRSASDADDLVQDACLKAITGGEKWDRAQPLDRWVFRIMRNHWISELRKTKVRLGEGHIPAEEANELVQTQTPEDAIRGTQLHRQIEQLPSDLAVLLLAVSVEGYTYAEAAETFDIPLGTVMSRIHRARKMLAAQLKEDAGGAS
ncbi:MAG: RNA polymerase sigma factor [Pseudomonadota bacterium]